MNVSSMLGSMALLVTLTSQAGVNVNVIVEGQVRPGVYGRVEVGSPSAPPPVWRAEPVIIRPVPQVVEVVPVYMHVPPGHARNWRKHCHRYGACGQPVYFVKSAEYEPGYGRKRKHGRDGEEDHHGRGERD